MKKFLIALLCIIVIVSVVVLVIYLHPDAFIGISKPIGTVEHYFEPITVGGQGRCNLPMPEYMKDRLRKLNDAAYEVEQELYNNYESCHVETDVIVKMGKTKLVYYGTVVDKETKETKEYNKEIIFDWVVTRTVYD